LSRAFSNVFAQGVSTEKVHLAQHSGVRAPAHSLGMALDQQNSSATDQSLSLDQFDALSLVHDDDEELDVVSTSEEAFVSKLPDNGTKTVCRPLHFRSCPLTLRLLVQLMAPRTLSPLLRLTSAGSRRSGRLTWCVASLSHASHCPSLGCRLQLLLVALLSHCPLSLPISHCRLHCKPVELACLSHCLSLSLSLSLPLPVTLHVSQSLTAPLSLSHCPSLVVAPFTVELPHSFTVCRVARLAGQANMELNRLAHHVRAGLAALLPYCLTAASRAAATHSAVGVGPVT
jgi:hypothetical protein